jgi:hypothetical protein
VKVGGGFVRDVALQAACHGRLARALRRETSCPARCACEADHNFKRVNRQFSEKLLPRRPSCRVRRKRVRSRLTRHSLSL